MESSYKNQLKLHSSTELALCYYNHFLKVCLPIPSSILYPANQPTDRWVTYKKVGWLSVLPFSAPLQPNIVDYELKVSLLD